MISINTPEFALLVATTARPGAMHHRRVIDAVQVAGRIDWAHFLTLVDRHRVAPLAFNALQDQREAIPNLTFTELRAKAMRDRAHALRVVNVLGIVQSRLASVAIDAVSIKGPTLAKLAFGDPTQRQCRDLDVLIPENQIEEALQVLRSDGFRVCEPSDIDLPGRLKLWTWLMKDLSLLHEPTGVLVELHWRLNSNPHLLPKTVAASRQEVGIGPIQARTLASDDLLLYLCVHGAKHLWFRLKWLADIYALMAEMGTERIARFVSYAAENGAAKPARQMLQLLEEVYGLPIHSGVTARPMVLTRWAIDTLGQVEEPTDRRFGNFKIQLAQLQLRSDRRYVARDLCNLLVDWPLVLARGGTLSSYVVAVLGRPVLWGMRKFRSPK